MRSIFFIPAILLCILLLIGVASASQVCDPNAVVTGPAPLVVNFTDISGNNPSAWSWQFRDTAGNNTWLAFSTTQNPSLTFVTPGTYQIRLNASNYGGTVSLTSGWVNATADAPLAAFSANVTSGVTPKPIKFTDSSAQLPTQWSWAYKNATVGWTWFSNEQHPERVFVTGVYDINLTATNAYGSDSEIKTAYITITSGVTAPVAGFTADVTSGVAPLTVHFTDTSTNSPTSYKWFVEGVDFNHNTTLFNDTFSSPGTYSVQHYAANSEGGDWENKTGYITVTATVVAPVADFSCTPLSGDSPLSVSCTDASTNTPTSWVWAYKTTGAWTQFSTAQNPSKSFSTGLYSINLTATNSAGSDKETKTNYIVSLEPTGGGGTVNFTMMVANATTAGTFVPIDPAHTVYRGDTVRFIPSVSSASYEWGFGDGFGDTSSSIPEHHYEFTKTPSLMRDGQITLGVSLVTDSGSFDDTINFTTNMKPLIMASETIALMNETLSENFTEAMGGNRTTPANWTGFDWGLGIQTVMDSYSSVLGPVIFYMLLYSLPFLMNWIATKDFVVAGIWGGFLGIYIIVRLPAQMQLLAVAFIVGAIVAVFWSLFKDR